uniref:Uncharacterized protein n=1 Tax=Anser brachyrhynchus TaxID=132585 RepID=A0A8B9CFN3_9AVES
QDLALHKILQSALSIQSYCRGPSCCGVVDPLGPLMPQWVPQGPSFRGGCLGAPHAVVWWVPQGPSCHGGCHSAPHAVVWWVPQGPSCHGGCLRAPHTTVGASGPLTPRWVPQGPSQHSGCLGARHGVPLQGWRLNHLPGQPIPMPNNPFSKGVFPNIQPKPPLAHVGEQTNPHLSTASFKVPIESDEVSREPPLLQAEQPQLPQPLLVRLVLQTPHQLRCPSLDNNNKNNIMYFLNCRKWSEKVGNWD